jgi:uncharacterized protein (TIGR02246 family)
MARGLIESSSFCEHPPPSQPIPEENMRMLRWMLPMLMFAFAVPARGDATAEAMAHSEKFAKACEAGDVKAVLDFYADDATVVWPGVGEEAKGKASIEKLVKRFCDPKTDLKLVAKSIEGIQLDDKHIATVGHWEGSFKGPGGKKVVSQVRTTEVLVKVGSGWQYVVDHASIGVSPPPAPKAHAKPTATKK